MNQKFSTLLLILAVLLLGGYIAYHQFLKPNPRNILANQNLPVVQMKLGDKTFNLEVANTEKQRQTGLMHRDSMPHDHGMIFVFNWDIPLQFWMKNTRIPLDILYINSQGVIVSTHTMKPFDETLIPSEGPSKWAIELNEGMIAKLGLKKGDKLDIPPQAHTTAE